MTQETLAGKHSFKTALPWLLAGWCTLSALAAFGWWWFTAPRPVQLTNWVDAVGWNLGIPIIFSNVAALILARRPAHRVGWLIMIPALTMSVPVSLLTAAQPADPTRLTPALWFMAWFEEWSWLPVIFSIFLIPLHFPTGRPPSPAWERANLLAIGMTLVLVLSVTFGETISSPSAGWTLPNPIGFVPGSLWEGPFVLVWNVGLAALVGSGVASLFIRYRRAQAGERQQIKWLLYAGGLFFGIYFLTIVSADFGLGSNAGAVFSEGLLNLALTLAILAFPAAIAIAILRHRLYDIDVIIRKTLVYAAVTGLLALVYFGSVVLLQGLFSQPGGERSPAAIVLSTLTIAALFNPLRQRVQAAVDRRFYRRKYDAEQALASFAARARDEVDLDQLNGHLVAAIQETVQPSRVSLWMREPDLTRKEGS